MTYWTTTTTGLQVLGLGQAWSWHSLNLNMQYLTYKMYKILNFEQWILGMFTYSQHIVLKVYTWSEFGKRITTVKKAIVDLMSIDLHYLKSREVSDVFNARSSLRLNLCSVCLCLACLIVSCLYSQNLTVPLWVSHNGDILCTYALMIWYRLISLMAETLLIKAFFNNPFKVFAQ